MDYSKGKQEQKIPGTTTVTDKKITKVIDGSAKKAKKGESRKIIEAFLPSDGIEGIKDHILMDVVIPTIKQIITDTINTILYGTIGPRGTGPINGVRTNRVSYDNYSSPKNNSSMPKPTRSSVYDFEDIVLETRGQALSVITCMQEIVAQYNSVCVSDLYEMVGLTGNYIDTNYGWLDLENVEVIQLRQGGYMIKLPRPVKLPSATII